MRALIVDDEAPARAKIRRLLEAAQDVDILGEATTGREAIALIKRTQPDLVFLDIQMPGLNGFDVAASIEQDGGAFIVFVTADDSHALRAFDVGAVDYLLKPFTPDRFARVLDRARERTMPDRQPRGAEREPLRRLLVIENGRAVFLPVDRIDRIEADRNYVQLFAGAERHRVRTTLAALGERLDATKFLQINRSTIVRLDAVREMSEWSHGDYRVVMHDGNELIWSRRFRAAAERVFGVQG
jgi:two-component system, LytTR family, response regulator